MFGEMSGQLRDRFTIDITEAYNVNDLDAK
jgi:hypothetical protein